MNIFALIALLSFSVCIFVAAFVYTKNSEALINKLYMLLSLALAAFALLQFGYRSSHSYEEACFWWRLDFFWPLITAIALHFTLAFTEKNDLLKRRWIYVVVYGPAAIVLFLDMKLHLFTGPPIRQDWGWTFSAPKNLANGLAYVWQQGIFILALVLAIRHFHAADDVRKKKQLVCWCLGWSIPILASTIELSLIFLSVEAPPFAVTAFVIGNCFVGYAIWRYEMFAISPITAAEHIVMTMPDSLLLVSSDGKIISTNPAAEKMLGLSQKGFSQLPIGKIFSHGSNRPPWLQEQKTGQHLAVDHVDNIDTYFHTGGDKDIPVSLASCALNDNSGQPLGFVLIGRDVSEQKAAYEELDLHRNNLEALVDKRTNELKSETFERLKSEQARAHLEEQLHQSQKMEAIGRLAGGVAHDFNNLLFVIAGYTETAMMSLAPHDPMRDDINEIANATGRAADLTQQLLAFSRKQIISPKVIDLRDTFDNIKRLLGRIIGEDIQLAFHSVHNLNRVRMDPVQVDQVLANLFINARDSMPSGGKLSVAAENVVLDESYSQQNPESKPGNYVRLSVSDTGCGMDENTKSRIFEPFFTTKGKGKGTGLGLSTVYGIAKQNRGFIEVESEPGVGTTFSIYIPIVASKVEIEIHTEETREPGGTETILLVEDDTMVRRLASQFLKKQGYKVIEADDAKDALTIFQRQRDDIDLLFTDIVMPGMSGKQLKEQLKGANPGLRVLYMTGHNDELIDMHGCLSTDTPLLQKPFSSRELSWKVREILDA